MSADVRKLLAASRKSRRITSPYASYSLAGALFCTICANQPIKSDALWDAHTSTPQHKANVAQKAGVATTSTAKARSHKRPADSSTAIDDDDAEGVEGGDGLQKGRSEGHKRLKTAASAAVRNLALPVGFFDNSDDDDGDGPEGIVSVGVAESPVEPPVAANGSKLPADFFSTTSTATGANTSRPPATGGGATSAPSKPTHTQDDEMDDEWAAFQADIAEVEDDEAPDTTTKLITTTTGGGAAGAAADFTISAPALTAEQIAAQNNPNPSTTDARTLADEEREEAQDAMADFFEEQHNLEERVKKLREQREALRQKIAVSNVTGETGRMQLDRRDTAVSSGAGSVVMGGMDGDEDEEEDYEDDDEMFFRVR